MMNRLQHQFELHGDAATLYVAGSITSQDVVRLRAACRALPPRVRTLRVDLHAITAPGPDAVTAMRGMLHDWRAERQGDFRLTLCTSHLVATYREHEDAAPPARFGAHASAHPHDALMGTYL